MRASQRYEIVGGWELEARKVTGPDRWGGSENESVTVTLHTATIHDPRGGWTYPGGAKKVRAVYTLSGKTWKGKRLNGRSKTFYGEFAWADSERLFRDIIAEVEYGNL